MGDIGLAIQRAEDKTQQLQARAGAVDELLSSGALADPLSTGSDDITRELNALASTAQVDNELEQLKRSLGQLEPGAPTQATPQLPAGQWQQPKNAPAAVSYTHLDVYKRQVMNAARTLWSSSCRTAAIVVPPGDETRSRNTVGCSPVSRSMVAAP